MNFSFSIKNWFALSSGLSNQSDWENWSKNSNHDWNLPLPKLVNLPMMQARRMSVQSRLAVEVGMELLKQSQVPDLAVFTSQHGEIDKTYKILSMLNQNSDISPTDFALSVHNTASGLLTIIAKKPIPITSISAHYDSFQQGLIEAISVLTQEDKTVLLIDFDGTIPDTYHSYIKSSVPTYAVGYIITKGNEISCQNITQTTTVPAEKYPQSLAFLRAYLNKQQRFIVKGNTQDWLWMMNEK